MNLWLLSKSLTILKRNDTCKFVFLCGAVKEPVKGPAQLVHQKRPNTVKHWYIFKATDLVFCTHQYNSIIVYVFYTRLWFLNCPPLKLHFPSLCPLPYSTLVSGLDIYSNIGLSWGKDNGKKTPNGVPVFTSFAVSDINKSKESLSG